MKTNEIKFEITKSLRKYLYSILFPDLIDHMREVFKIKE